MYCSRTEGRRYPVSRERDNLLVRVGRISMDQVAYHPFGPNRLFPSSVRSSEEQSHIRKVTRGGGFSRGCSTLGLLHLSHAISCPPEPSRAFHPPIALPPNALGVGRPPFHPLTQRWPLSPILDFPHSALSLSNPHLLGSQLQWPPPPHLHLPLLRRPFAYRSVARNPSE